MNQNLSVNGVWFSSDWFGDGSTIPYQLTNPSFLRNRIWTHTPNIRALRKAGRFLPTLPYSDSRWELSMAQVNASFPPWVGNGGKLRGAPTRASILVSASLLDKGLSSLTDKAFSKASSKIGDSTINLGITAAESHKTFSMFNNAVKTLAASANDVRRGRFASAAHRLGLTIPSAVSSRRSFQNNWLEYRYGWRNLVFDVNGAVVHLAHHFVDKPPVIVVKSHQTDSSSWWDRNILGTSYPTSIGGDILFDVLYERELAADVTYRYEVVSSALDEANELGLVNPALIAWDLVPFSFVVDWFISVGESLQNMTSFVGKRFLDGSLCQMCSITSTHKVVAVKSKSGDPALSFSPAYAKVKDRVFQRDVLSDFVYLPPKFRLNLSEGKLVDAVTLLSQYKSTRKG